MPLYKPSHASGGQGGRGEASGGIFFNFFLSVPFKLMTSLMMRGRATLVIVYGGLGICGRKCRSRGVEGLESVDALCFLVESRRLL